MLAEKSRILIVDDEAINIQVLEATLRSDYEIDSAAGGREALRKAKECQPDLILLDVMMPGLNGFEVCRTLKADETLAHIPIIFMTALDSGDGEMEGLEAGGIDYLTKPVHIGMVRLRVRNHMELVRSRHTIVAQRDLLAQQNKELESTLARIKRLEGIIPICMYCKEIRDSSDVWHQLEAYISQHSDALFSHGICPSCMEKEFPTLHKMQSEKTDVHHE